MYILYIRGCSNDCEFENNHIHTIDTTQNIDSLQTTEESLLTLLSSGTPLTLSMALQPSPTSPEPDGSPEITQVVSQCISRMPSRIPGPFLPNQLTKLNGEWAGRYSEGTPC